MNKISVGELEMSVIDNDVKEPMNSSGRKRECVQCICPRRKNDVSSVLREADMGVFLSLYSFHNEATVYYSNVYYFVQLYDTNK